MFDAPEPERPLWKVVLWWELRRIPFNLIVGLYGIACLAIFFWAILTSGELAVGDDAVEPLGLIAAPFVINFLYTLGWLVEVPARIAMPKLSPRFGPILLAAGLGFGLFLITLPAGFWLGFRVLQLLGVVSITKGAPQ
jgi:hypothetical protein